MRIGGQRRGPCGSACGHKITKGIGRKPELLEELPGALLPGARDHRHHTSTLPNSSGATRTVHVAFRIIGRVSLHHNINIINVNAARGNVSRNQHLSATGGKSFEVSFSARLAEVAMQRHGSYPCPAQQLSDMIDVCPSATEHDGSAGVLHQFNQRRIFVFSQHDTHPMLNSPFCAIRFSFTPGARMRSGFGVVRALPMIWLADLMHSGPRHKLCDQRFDGAVERC